MSDRTHPRILSACLLAGGVACFLAAVYFCIHFYTAAPFADSWNILDEVVMNHGRPSLGMLWEQHNEHRMAIPKLLMWADMFWARGKGWSLFAEIYLVQFVAALVLLYAVRRLGKWSWVESRAAFGVALFCVFCPVQWEVFIWSFGIQVVPAYALAAFAFVGLARYSMTGSRGWLAVVIFAAFAAPLHLAGALAAWPVLCVAGWNLRLRARTLALLAGCGAVSIGTYLAGYRSPPNHGDTLGSLAHLGDLSHYVLLYFAGSWDAVGRPLGYLLAAVAIVAVVGANAAAAIRRVEAPLRLAMLGLSLLLVLNACLTAAGRLRFGIEQATASRYQTSALLFWCCIFILLADVLRQFAPKALPVLSITALAAMVLAAVHVSTPWREAAFWANRIEAGTVPLLADVKDDPVLAANLIGTPFLIFRDTGFLRARGMSLYDSAEYRRMGVLLPDVYDVAGAARCVGYFDKTEAIADSAWPGYRASGWGWDTERGQALEKVVLTNEKGRIVGLARGGLERSDVKRLVPVVKSSFSGWQGYINGALEWRHGRAYGELPGGRQVCPLPGSPGPP